MKLRYDPESGALYIRTAEGEIEETVQHADGAYLDIDAHGRILGVEFLPFEELAYTSTGDGGWELPERIEAPEAYEAARGERLTRMRPNSSRIGHYDGYQDPWWRAGLPREDTVSPVPGLVRTGPGRAARVLRGPGARAR